MVIYIFQLSSLHIDIRKSQESSISSIAGSFNRKIIDAKIKHDEQQEYLQEILKLEHEEQKEVENKLNVSEIRHIKDEQIEHKHTIEKVKRRDIIDQKRIDKESKRKMLSNCETDPFKQAEAN